MPSRASPRQGEALTPRLSHTVAFDKSRDIQSAGWATSPWRRDRAWASLWVRYAVDALPTPEWLVITDGQQNGHWRLLHNSTGRGQRCSVGCTQRYQPTLRTAEQRKAQDYTFEALHRIYFYDAWRTQPVLGAPESELVLPPQPGLLIQGCYWPQRSAVDDVLSVSDVATEAGDQSCQTPTSPETTDAIMAEEEASDVVSVLSSPSESSTLPSTVLQEEAGLPNGRQRCGCQPTG